MMFPILFIAFISISPHVTSQDIITINYGDSAYMDSFDNQGHKIYRVKKNLGYIDLKIIGYLNADGYGLVPIRNGKFHGNHQIVYADGSVSSEYYENDSLVCMIHQNSKGNITSEVSCSYFQKDTLWHSVGYFDDGRKEFESYSINQVEAFKSASWYVNGGLKSLSYYRVAWKQFSAPEEGVVYEDDPMSNPMIFDEGVEKTSVSLSLRQFRYLWFRNGKPRVEYKFTSPDHMREYQYDSTGNLLLFYTYRYGLVEFDGNYSYSTFETRKSWNRGNYRFKGWHLDGISRFESYDKVRSAVFVKGKLIRYLEPEGLKK